MRLAAVRQRMARGPAGSDTGVTLLEVVVSMTIMSMLMSIFTVGVAQMYHSASRAEAVSASQSQTYIVFQRLEREIRYASAIGDPAQINSDWYVEYLSTNDGSQLCSRLWLRSDTAQLLLTTWPLNNPPATWEWTRLVSNVSAPAAPNKPFTTAAENFQTLQVRLLAQPAGSGSRDVSESNVTFTALNTLHGTDTSRVCTEGRGQ